MAAKGPLVKSLLSQFRELPRSVILLLLLAVVAGIAWLWLWGPYAGRDGQAKRRAGQPVAVKTTAVQRVTLHDVRTFPGTLEAEAAFDVAPKIAGRLEKLNVDVGDAIKQGQVVARLDDDEQVQQVNQARAELGVAQASLVEAKSLLAVKDRQFERSKRLFKQGIGSEEELETARAEAETQRARVQVAQAQLVQSKAALRAAEVRLSYTVIRAQWSGKDAQRVVGERYVNEGEMLAANKPILSVLGIGSLIAVVHVTEMDYRLVHPGQALLVTADAVPERRFPGVVARLAPHFQQESRQARMEATVANPERVLKPGMFIRVEIEVGSYADAMVVPAESVVTRAGREGVFLIDPQRSVARFVPVRTGLTQGDRVQVLEPELKGQVASLGQHLLRDGATVRLVDSPDGAGPGKPGAAAGKPKQGKAP